MQFPQININGTAAHQLLQENMDALAAVQTALEHLRKVTVHGRDYQTITDIHGAFLTAQREHVERLRKLESVEADLTAIAGEISSQLREYGR